MFFNLQLQKKYCCVLLSASDVVSRHNVPSAVAAHRSALCLRWCCHLIGWAGVEADVAGGLAAAQVLHDVAEYQVTHTAHVVEGGLDATVTGWERQ